MKTKLGISVGLMGALLYFAALLGGWTPLLLIAGYVLICESDTWLRKTAVTAVLLMLVFYLVSILVNIFPNLLGLLDDLLRIFNKSVSLPVLNRIVNFLSSFINLAEKVVFILLGALALEQKGIKLGFVDKFIDKHTKD